MGRSRQTTTSGPDQWTQQQFQQRAGEIERLMGSPFQMYEGPVSADLTDAEREAMAYFQSLMGGEGGFAGADLSAYMNPYLDEVLGATMGDINRQRDLAIGQTGDAAARAGAFGGSRHGVAQAETERAYGDIGARTAAQLRGEAFNQAAGLFGQDVNRRMQGAMGAANIGAQQRMQDQLGLDRRYQEFLRQYEDPFRRAGVQMGILGTMPRGQTQTTTSRPGFMDIAGTALQAGGLLFSDARLKQDIEPIGERDGHNWYRYRYTSGGPVHEGVLAQEVMQTKPQAVVRDPSGFMRVNYEAL